MFNIDLISKETMISKAMEIGVGVDLSSFNKVLFIKDFCEYLNCFSYYETKASGLFLTIRCRSEFIAKLHFDDFGISFVSYDEGKLSIFMPTLFIIYIFRY